MTPTKSQLIPNRKVKALTSLPNLVGQTSGWRWSTIEQIQATNSKRDDAIILDYFVMYDEMLKLNELPTAPYCEITIDPVMMTRGMLLLGIPGSGKSVFYWNLIRQKWWGRVIAHDYKPELGLTEYGAGDWFMNPFDERHANWSLWLEFQNNPIAASAFLSAIVKAANDAPTKLSGNQGFFLNSGAELILEIFSSTFYANEGASDKDLWILFFAEWEKRKGELDTQGEGKQGIVMTIQLSIKFFKLMARHAHKTAKTIKDFFAENNNIWLVNQGDLQADLNAFFSGFLAAVVNYHCTQPLQRKDLTFYLFDEAPQMSFQLITIKQIMLTLRGFGGCPVIGMQMFDRNAEELQYYKAVAMIFVFQLTIDNDTMGIIKELFASVKAEQTSKSQNYGPNGQKSTTDAKSGSISIDKIQEDFLPPELIPSFKNGEHLSFIPNIGAIYIGQAPMRTAIEYIKGSKRIDIHQMNKDEIRGKTEKAIKPLASLAEKREIYNKIVAAETVEEATQLLLDNGFENLDLEALENLFNPNHYEPTSLPEEPEEYLKQYEQGVKK